MFKYRFNIANCRLGIIALVFNLHFVIINCYAQTNTIDSLKLALKNAKHDTTRVITLLAIAEHYYLSKPDTALFLCKKAAASSEKMGFINGMAESYGWLMYLTKEKGDIMTSIDYNSKCLKILEKKNDKYGVATCLNNIGVIYENLHESDKALEYLSKSLAIREEIGDKQGVSISLNNVGRIYDERGDLNKAITYYRKSLKIREETNDKRGIANSYNNIGFIYNTRGNSMEALDYYYKSLKIREELGDKKGTAISLNNIGGVYVKLKEYNKSLTFCLKSLHISEAIGFPENIANAAINLYEIYKIKGDFNKALKNYELYILMRDSIANEQTKKASIKDQLKYEYQKRAAADSVKNAEEQKVKEAQIQAQNAQIKQEKFQRYALFAGLALVIAGLIFAINRFKITQRQKRIIEKQKIIVDEAFEELAEKNKEVLDSIHYARRIQRSLMTHETYIEKSLKRLSKPKFD